MAPPDTKVRLARLRCGWKPYGMQHFEVQLLFETE
jgi:hypothetical protein